MAQMPKRRKSKDNPYTLNYDETTNIYTIEFNDGKKEFHKIEISQKLYNIFNQFELEDLSQMNKFDNHIEHLELDEISLYKRTFLKEKSVEDEVETLVTTEHLKTAINTLTESQKRRLKLYYFEDKNLREIADLENCSIASVKESIDTSIKKINKILKK